jgi:predicted transcriptional regulator
MKQSLPQPSPEKQEIASGIIRIHKENNFAVLSNALLQDERLSAAATGCIAYLLSKPNDWQLRREDIMRRFDCGKDKAQSMLRELEQAGYLVRETTRDDQGRFKHVSVIHEKPQQITEAVFSGAGKPSHLLSTDLTKNRKKKVNLTLSLLPFQGENKKHGKETSNTPIPSFSPSHVDAHQFVWGDKRVSIGEAVEAYSQHTDEYSSAPWYWLMPEIDRLRNGIIKPADFDRFIAKEWAGIELAKASLTNIKEIAA